ncbi:leucine-rich repeat domain-containing protein [Porphyromonas uenonis]|uniref:leucine-rich repeat domain-containing protein n=1 Tax=Porphyromonas uenonis TaxID=281920 RepID=UPI0026F223BC|nr:leucine-rich repeat domain-containing protein [Porphyromonas uenonis]
MIKKLLFIAGLVATMSGLSLQATAQTAELSNHGDGGVMVPSCMVKKDRQLMSQDLKATDTRKIYKTKEGFNVRYVDKDKKTVEIAKAQDVSQRKPGVYGEKVVVPEILNVEEDDKGKVIIPCTVVAVGEAAFAFNNVSSIKLPATCTELKDRAFSMTDMEMADIPDHIEKMGDNVFLLCSSLTKVRIGKGLKKMGADPFLGCTNIGSIEVNAENPILSEKDGILYNKAQTILYLCPMQRKNVVSVTLPNTVKEIADNAFYDCTYIKTINLNEGLEKIGEDAFYGCGALEEMTIPASVKEIAPGAFYQLKKYNAFKLAEGNTVFEVKSDGVNEGKLLINKVKNSLHTCLFKGTNAVTIPEGIKIVEPYAFLGCLWTASVKIPASVERVGRASFSEMYSLKEIEIPEKVTEIPKYCISDCKKLTKITLGKGVKKVENKAFSGNDAMANTGGTLQILATTPPAVGKNDEGKLYDMGEKFYDNVVLEVPREAREAYQKDVSWGLFFQIYPLGNEYVQPVSPLQISVAGGRLSIVAPEVAPIAVYTLDGQVIYTTSAQEAQLALPAGLYMVTYGTQATKVLVD